MDAAELFARGDTNAQVARDLRVTVRQVERWRHTWREAGTQGLRSAGSPARSKLTEDQFAALEAELDRGPLAHGWDDQRWTLERIAEVIHRTFAVTYTPKGVNVLLARRGWTWQSPTRRAIERDDQAVATWVQEGWPQEKPG